ncbi:hypothetical protein [Pareuzebyella sediminis]|uniref:hypothetical protein n=1 Tax=Pareuzebyella sediminis TaxID=2607998 RepID=UPI0011EEBE8E|nr:hypothetical protein [Pareuzebyella sediminis]
MRWSLTAIALFVLQLGMAQLGGTPSFSNGWSKSGQVQQPEFFIFPWEPGTRLQEKKTSLSIEIDSMGMQPIKALVNEGGRTTLYVSDISTPVCADGDCRLMDIRLYWTLLGGYAGFDRYRSAPLTKHDHDEFVYADYLKLHQLLLDDNSILKRRKIDELVKKPAQPEEEGVDAIAGATIKEVKESVVSGALYSCYTAWHLVNGGIKDKIKDLTISTLNNELLEQMLMTDNSDYQMFVLKRLSDRQYEQYYVRIAEIFGGGIPLVRTLIVKNLPETIWNSERLQEPFWGHFERIDINTRSLLLGHLSEAPASVVHGLSNKLGQMTKNQLKIYLEYLSESQFLDTSILDNLKNFSSDQREANAYLVSYFLEDLRL